MKILWSIALLFLLSVSPNAQSQSAQAQTEDSLDVSGNAFLRLCSVVDKEGLTGVERIHMAACLAGCGKTRLESSPVP